LSAIGNIPTFADEVVEYGLEGSIKQSQELWRKGR